MAILSDFNNALNRAQPAVGSGSSSIGTTIFVMHTNAKQNNGSDYNNPSLIVHGAGTNNGNVKPIVVPSMGLHLELYLAYYGTAPAVDTPVIALYGEVPYNGNPNGRFWPQDVDSNLTQTSADGTAHDTSFWVPLLDWDHVEYQTDHKDIDAHHLIAMHPDSVSAVNSDGGDAVGMVLSVPRRVYVSGCTRVICTVETAAANATAAMILGRFVG